MQKEIQPETSLKGENISDTGKEVVSQFAAWQRVEKQLSKLLPVKIEWNKEILNDGQKKMLRKLIEAAKVMDEIFLMQVSIRNVQIRSDLEISKDPKASLIKKYFDINFGPYDRFDKNHPFINVPLKPPGATFYPQNMTKDEFIAWLVAHPQSKKMFIDPFTIIVRTKEGLEAIPYSQYYKEHLQKAADFLKEASLLCDNKSLRKYLDLRAKAFLTNDYYESDIAWLDVKDNLIDVTIGPYETYEDSLYGYKASFEAFICLRDPDATKQLEKIEEFIPEMEKSIPGNFETNKEEELKKNPIVVVDVIFTAGDAKAGVQTIAFNLPNDERVRAKKGSKKVLLRNFIKAKYDAILYPIAQGVISQDELSYVSSDEFFSHVLLHEISHGIGPGFITKGKKKTEVRVELKDLYSAIEEAKADVLGMWAFRFLQKKGVFPAGSERKMWVTFLASIFRSIRFGIDEAHGKADLLILNYLFEKGAYRFDEKSHTFSVDFNTIEKGVEDLSSHLIEVESKGDYEGARKLIEKYGVVSDSVREILNKLEGIYVDIIPEFDLDF